ncbi:SERTA domain-containing protein 4-like [Thalassophryne amazonica]|uniref:SERTA domain-containing protein 4-like n=1 Tax=Thalassophryne amazonica TaxID=390379 RepID=UPI00147096B8|nr:SERTA domain-containing protein 4-like [Thalassophryne amazonica]XP_034015657.1 SERTA domain-containing protein 4-like [Thalassophryne amazonica]
MTLVLSMNPFLDPEGDPPLSAYQTIWELEHCTKICLSSSDPPHTSELQFTQKPHCIRVPDNVSLSRIAYFKRKFVDDDDDPRFSIRSYCQTVAPVLEERTHVLRLSLEKMQFIDDPETFLRRSVLVNNLLRRLRAEILLQSADWCFPPNLAFTSNCVLPSSTSPGHQGFHRAVPSRICLLPQPGPPFRKRFRMVRGDQGELRPDCSQRCCCIYAAAGHYLHLPFSMYDAAISSCTSTPHSSPLFHLTNHSKLGLTVSIEEHDDEDEDGEEEENEEDDEKEENEDDDERRMAGSSLYVCREKFNWKSRTRTLPDQKPEDMTKEDCCVVDRVEEEENGEEEEEEQTIKPCLWDSTVTQRQLPKASMCHHRDHRQ